MKQLPVKDHESQRAQPCSDCVCSKHQSRAEQRGGPVEVKDRQCAEVLLWLGLAASRENKETSSNRCISTSGTNLANAFPRLVNTDCTVRGKVQRAPHWKIVAMQDTLEAEDRTSVEPQSWHHTITEWVLHPQGHSAVSIPLRRPLDSSGFGLEKWVTLSFFTPWKSTKGKEKICKEAALSLTEHL